MVDCQRAAAREIDPYLPAAGLLASDLIDCVACGGVRQGECSTCGGLGMVTRPDPREVLRGDHPPAWALTCGDFLSAWSLMRDHGVDGMVRLMGITDLDPLFVEACQVFDGEKARLEHEDKKREASDRRARNRT